MLAEKYITGSCTISKGITQKDEIKIFDHPGVKLPDLLLANYQHFVFNYPKFYKMDNLSKLGWLAGEVLLKDFRKERYQPEEIGVVLANSSSSLDTDLKYYDTIQDIPSPSVFVYTLPNIVIGEICIRHKFKGEHAFFIQDTFNADFLEKQVNYLLDENILQACICGWVDVLDKEYKVVLFLVEKQGRASGPVFSAQQMNRIFNNS